jgi:hypothetical protein
MRRRGLVTMAAGAAAAFALAGAAPADAATYGGGAVTGTLVCSNGEAAVTLDSPAFVFNGAAGPLHASGTTGCIGSLLVDSGGSATFQLEGPGVSCGAGFGGGWLTTGTHLTLILGGPCTFAGGGGENVQFVVDAQLAAGTFAGAAAVSPTWR